MKKKIIQILFLCTILINAMIISAGTVSCASTTEEQEISELESIQPYAEILNALNTELGTSFAFPTNEALETAGMDREEVIADILSTDIEDYEQLIRNQYGNLEQGLTSGIISGNEQAGLMSTTQTQKAYYTSSNYVYINATTYYADGTERYSSINSYGEGHSATPYYNPYDLDSSLSSNSTTYTCYFYCYKMLNSSVSYDSWTKHKLQASFVAGGGDPTATVLY